MSSEAPSIPTGKLMKADNIAAIYRSDVENSIRTFTSSSAGGRKPRLVGILATNSKPSESYAEFTQKTCEAIGVDFILKRVGAALSEKDDPKGEGVELAIIEANEDEGVDGIMACSTRDITED